MPKSAACPRPRQPHRRGRGGRTPGRARSRNWSKTPSMPARAAIAVRLAAGGLDLIEVTDDGCGMAPDDMRLALERHATSKLPDDAIETGRPRFGFRGEALPSIASVARLTLESRPRGRAKAGGAWSITASWRARGPPRCRPARGSGSKTCSTRCPARRKFLRSRARRICRLPRCRCAAWRWRGPTSASRSSMTAGGCWRCSRARRGRRGSRSIVARELADDGVAIDCERGRAAADRRRRPADLQPRRGRSPVSVRQRPPGEGPAADRRGARGLSRHAGARPPRGAGAVPRRAARGGRRQRPPGQDRGPLPRSGLRARA